MRDHFRLVPPQHVGAYCLRNKGQRMIIDGIEYEDEPSYTDIKTGKPVYYAKHVPDLLRGAGMGVYAKRGVCYSHFLRSARHS
ncbi:hypothetical protein [Kordiimonas aquimaris]|uniref:hypothetical protein n=1 Tax=Kordiimonas aquimaris TaxID=707591 RepID=UPI0021D3E4EB|nr:hypothetical protein [Kordiimonas aquimaris]